LGASIGTFMMMVVPAMVLQRAVRDQYPPGVRHVMMVFLVSTATLSFSGIAVMALQTAGVLPKVK